MSRLLCLLVFFFSVYKLTAQQFSAYPPNTKWKQINTDTARIIFTGNAGSQAERIAAIIHQMAVGTPDPIGQKRRKINIVLHSATTLANGYVGLAPFRSEYYLIPGGNIFEFGNLPWNEQLAVHEYRHVLQYSNFKNGLSKAFFYVFGEQGQAFANAVSIPDWFFEGDAVHAETAFTNFGRGRLPYFLNDYNSLWREGKKYSWEKLRNGSYKDFVPNHYYLGYLLVNYGYEKYGPNFWQKVTRDASAFKGLFYPLQKAVKRHTDVDYKTFRNEAFEYYKQKLPTEKPVSYTKDKTVINYYFPQLIGRDSLLYLKTSYRQLPTFVIKKSNNEQKLKLKNISSEDWFNYHNGKIVYTAYATNARWSLKDYSDIILLDIATKKEERLTKKGRYYTPSFSKDGKQIICVAINDSLETELQLINIGNKEIAKTIKAPQNSFYTNPTFIDDNTIIVSLRLPDGLLTMQKINLKAEEVEPLIAPSPNTFGYPFVQHDTVYFTGSFAANDDLYALTLSDKKVYQLTTGITGNYFPNEKNDLLFWSVYTANGFKVKQQALSNFLWKEVAALQLQNQRSLYKVADATTNILQTPNRIFPIRNYSKNYHLINVHSWQPDYEEPEFSVSLLSNNILNTLAGNLYYVYNQNEKSNAVGLSMLYGGCFPIIKGEAKYTFNRHINTGNRLLLLNQYELRGGYYVPLTFTRGKTYKLLNFGSDYVYNQLMPASGYKNIFAKQSISYLQHTLSWRQQLPTAVQHIYLKLGYTASVNYSHRLEEKGYRLLTNAAVYLPGLFRNHSLVLSGSFQQTDTGNVVFTNNFVNARGYADYYLPKMWRTSVNYHFPIAYPDWGFGNILYLLRLRANVYYDYSRVYNKILQHRDLRSTGAELFFDTKWWNQLPVTFGVRYSYLLDQGLSGGANRHVVQVVLPVDLIP